MFRFDHVELVHWDYWQRCAIPLNSEIVTVIGPNGSGKTTLLDALRTLLAIQCSSGRDYKRYVRRAGRPYAWIRAVVTNPRRSGGQLAFWPLRDPQVTLFCHIRKKGGEWERRYGVAAGIVSLDEAETSESVNWVGVRQYESQLEAAGLTRAIKRVLSLDQGHTDKLCEYSGRQLLELVFQVFGDQEVLDNYQHAQGEQVVIERELQALNTTLAQLGSMLEEAKAQVRSYEEYQRLVAEIADLEGQWLPRVTLAELTDAIKGGRRHLLGAKRELAKLKKSIAEREAQLAEVTSAIRHAERQRDGVRREEVLCQDRVEAAQKALAVAQAVLLERDRLQRLGQTAGFDAAEMAEQISALRARHYDVRQQIQDRTDRLARTRADLAALQAGNILAPKEVEGFRATLVAQRIDHIGLAEAIEVTAIDWHAAVEAVLSPLAHMVLITRPEQLAAAWQLGEVLRFRHLLASDPTAELPEAPRGTLGECVRFRKAVPVWLPELLNCIHRIECVADAEALPPNAHWITRDGYQRDVHGAKQSDVADYVFGEGAATQLRSRIPSVERELSALEEEEQSLQRRVVDIELLIGGIDAGKQLLARAAEFAQAESAFPQLEAVVSTTKQALQDRRTGLRALDEELRVRERASGSVSSELNRLNSEREKGGVEYHGARDEQVRRLQALRTERRGKPTAWRTTAGYAQAKQRYGSRQAVIRDIERLEAKRTDDSWVKDPSCLGRREKYSVDYKDLSERIESQKQHLEAARGSTDRARAQYINVLKGTLRRYAENIRKLGALAGIQVTVEYPPLANDDATLARAALEVKFDFDQKGPMGLNDGEASGGQQVMKSMILLVGLMTEESSGGFVFIDEPFAHLDIFNIDKVGVFLQATRAQYILTTPNTHNVNVFKSSDLTLVTQKRRPGDSWAPPVAFLRRAREAALAK